MRTWLSAALVCVWAVTLASADTAITPAMHCQGHAMPCCPHSGPDGARCAPVQCAEQAFQKSDSRDALEAPALGSAAAPAAVLEQPSPFAPQPLFAIAPRASVFRLKDDLRI